MALLRFLVAAAAVAMLCACGGSSISEFGGDNQQLGKLPAESAGRAPKDTDARKDADAQPRDQDSAVRKVALNLSSVSDPHSKAYKIGPRDVLEVTVFKVPDLSKVVQVSEAGTISYPLVGEVQAGGRTAREIEQDLTKLLGAKYLQNPQISVFVREYNSQRITLEGAFKKTGVYPITGGMTLLQATAQAGGFEQTADETVVLFRQVNGKRMVAKYDVGKIREFKAEDPELEAGDVIIAPTSDVKEGLNYVLRLAPLASLVPLL